MRLKNKKTGEIVEVITGDTFEEGGIQIRSLNRSPQIVRYYTSLAELNEEWEDYEEPKPQVVYYIDRDGEIVPYRNIEYPKRVFNTEQNKEIGNYFETREEAEKAVEKLKAWKRLKDKGLHVTTFYVEDGSLVIRAKTHNSSGAENWEDLDLLFGGEE